MTRDEMIARLEAAGVDVDRRWSDSTLRSKLEPVSAPQQDNVKKIACRVLRDFWPTDSDMDRVRKGQIVELDVEAALDGIEAGAVQRVK